MFEDINKSIKATLYERTSSPLIGSFIVSWLAWNWRIVYFVFAADQKLSIYEKLDCVAGFLREWHYSIIAPLLSTVFFIVVYPYINNGAYWLSLNFEKWRHDKKLAVENTKALSVEQSVELRLQVNRMKEDTEKIVKDRDDEIKRLGAERARLITTDAQSQRGIMDLGAEFEKLKKENLGWSEVRNYYKLKLGSLLMGSWVSTYTGFEKANGVTVQTSGTENFVIDSDSSSANEFYRIGDVNKFKITDVYFDSSDGILMFTKTALASLSGTSRVVLYRAEPNKAYRGFELGAWGNFNILFKKS